MLNPLLNSVEVNTDHRIALGHDMGHWMVHQEAASLFSQSAMHVSYRISPELNISYQSAHKKWATYRSLPRPCVAIKIGKNFCRP